MTMSAEQRKDPEVARAMFKKLLPSEMDRAAVLGALAESIVFAHALSRDRWGVSLLDNVVRLNLGSIEVLAVFREELHLILYCPKIPVDLKSDAGAAYAKVPQSCYLNVHYSKAQATWEATKGAWRELARRASETPRHSMTRKAHSPGVLEYLRRAGWPDVPNPLSAA